MGSSASAFKYSQPELLVHSSRRREGACSNDQHGAAGSVHDLLRYAAQQDAPQPRAPAGREDEQVRRQPVGHLDDADRGIALHDMGGGTELDLLERSPQPRLSARLLLWVGWDRREGRVGQIVLR